jgi:molybdopterin-guanine dinucleotide biosynthesis protein A
VRKPEQSQNIAISRPIGAILAGGRGARIGGAKAKAELGGKPLIAYPIATLLAVLEDVVVVVKADTELPPLPEDVQIWVEPREPRHPISGIVEALKRAKDRPVLVCAADMPFVTPATIERLAAADPAPAPAVIAAGNPLLGLYLPEAAENLTTSSDEHRPLRELIAAIGPRTIDVDEAELVNINTPAELRQAQPNVKS